MARKEKLISIVNNHVTALRRIIKDMQMESFTNNFPPIETFEELAKCSKDMVYWLKELKELKEEEVKID